MSKSILIVDDSKIVRDLMRDFLENATEWKVAGEAEDGTEAIKKAKALEPDLVLLDYSMPALNGIETASILKKLLPDVRIILFTMFDDALGTMLCSAVGVDMVVPKPDGMTNLVRSVQRLMETAGLTD